MGIWFEPQANVWNGAWLQSIYTASRIDFDYR